MIVVVAMLIERKLRQRRIARVRIAPLDPLQSPQKLADSPPIWQSTTVKKQFNSRSFMVMLIRKWRIFKLTMPTQTLPP